MIKKEFLERESSFKGGGEGVGVIDGEIEDKWLGVIQGFVWILTGIRVI